MLRFLANIRFRSFLLTLTALSLLVANAWIPLPIPIEKDLSVPFPCQSKGCGCKDARQCWDNCCCYTDAEKLAWADRNGVKPPDWFLDRVGSGAELVTKTPTKKKCCCCCSQSKPPVAEEKQESHSTVFLVLKQQKSCQGQVDGVHSFEILLGFATPPPQLDALTASPLFASIEAQPSLTFLSYDPLPS